jgi:hypothetical protein
MAERIERQPLPDRLVCPNCPADYPTQHARRYITCRRCETSFLAPDDARTRTEEKTRTVPAREHGSDSTEQATGSACELRFDESASAGDGERASRLLRAIRRGTPMLALGFSVAAVCFWAVGAVTFEAAVLTMILVTNGALVESHL